ncbi:unnamed protein product [Phytophthora lilii]|uniref:Unnamed protein product n=1 Tax=Phytophthora lilii TaxID=2077276 RepID=A0A9W6YJS9_9STRA|nr:unnamed protein product [Phytophthora lilii]
MAPSPLETLSATLLAAADAAEQEPQDVDWAQVSAALAALRLRSQEALTELATALDPAESPPRAATVGEQDELLAVDSELKSLQPEVTVAEQHFLQLESIVRPGLSKLQRLQTRAKYLEAAVQVEKLSQEAKSRAVQATPDALEAFRAFATFAAAVPAEFLVIRVSSSASKTQRRRRAKGEQTSAHTRFLAHALTPELHRHRDEVHCWDAQILLLRGLVKAVCRKLTQDLPTLIAVSLFNFVFFCLWFVLTIIICWNDDEQHPPLLCHTLDEVLLFEQTIDDDVGYGSWASADRGAYPRCVDVFTSSNDVLFAWTSADVEYAHRVLSSSLEIESSGDKFDLGLSREKLESIWQLEGDLTGGPITSEDDQYLVPPAALRFVALLDFLSQRFTLMETEEHRYLYVMQVHLPLLRQFGQLCDAHGRRVINTLTKTDNSKAQAAWEDLFVVVNALQYVARALAAWEQSGVFLELSKKVARSETTRAHVLRMHVAYSKQVLARASAAVLATEEATAVRQALAGPGAMIGPTAAFSAAYSVGSKTMKSLFRRAETDGKAEDQSSQIPSEDSAPPASATSGNGNDSAPINGSPEQDDPETLLFSHTIFERQILELKSLATTLLEGGKNALMRVSECDIESYRLSPFWTDTHDDDADKNKLHIVHEVSSELASCYTFVSTALSSARKVLLPECWPALWKPLASALDGALFEAFNNSASVEEYPRLSSTGERQFVKDIECLVDIFAAGSSKALPRSYFRLTREVCHLLEMPASRLREVCKALDDDSVVAFTGADSPDQLVTILEACGIFSLTPAQVVRICTSRLDLDGRTSG